MGSILHRSVQRSKRRGEITDLKGGSGDDQLRVEREKSEVTDEKIGQ